MIWRAAEQRLRLRQLELRLRSATLRGDLQADVAELLRPLGWMPWAWRGLRLVRGLPPPWRAAATGLGVAGVVLMLRRPAKLAGLLGLLKTGLQALRLWRAWQAQPAQTPEEPPPRP
ncbi:hypothetical protein [Paucibacter soli]|uniref:hypothetical protein n=1 Tax=Paucibacter soli TaxID=3133433 RepID=UPI0030AB1E5A